MPRITRNKQKALFSFHLFSLLIILINSNINNNSNVIKESSHLIEEMLFKVMLKSI